MKLTKSNIDKKASPPKGDAFYWDTELKGFGLRVNAAGKSFIVQGRIGSGRTAPAARITIGRYGVFTVDQARDRARKHLINMRDGIDPRARSEAQRTVRQIADDYLRDIQLKPRSKEAIEKIVAGPFTKFGWTDKPLASITRDEVSERFLELRERTPAYANHIFGTLRAFFNHAITKNPEAFDKGNPVKVLRRMWAEEKVRTGRIPDDKLSACWKHLSELRLRANKRHTRASIDFVSFLLLTGCRRSEAAELTWVRVNLDEGWWHIADTKNSNPVWLPLPTQAVELLRERQKRFGREGLVFGIKDPRDTMASISRVAGLHLSPHDLRRTFTNVGIQLCNIEIVKLEQLTNHVPKSVLGRHYTERQKLQYLRPEVQQIADRIVGLPCGGVAGSATG
jgi:integrase